MKTLVLTYFWLMLIVSVIRVLEMSFHDWPVEREPKTLGLATSELIVGLGFMMWAAIVLWL